MAPILVGIMRQPERFNSIVCATGQHRDMSHQVLASFDILPNHDLNVMTENQKLTDLTARIITLMDDILSEVLPDLVLVQGDTTTALAAALAAFYNRVPVGHIEAGLRTADMQSPFPEEANRALADKLATYCFAPTELNRNSLLNEGIPQDRIYVTGNTVVDALLLIAKKVSRVDPKIWSEEWGTAKDVILDKKRPLVLVTAHRRESFGKGLRSICETLRGLAQHHADWEFVYPVHLNPNVQGPAVQFLSGVPNIHLLNPLSYEAFVYLMMRARFIMSDSGGIQEEASSLGKPVVLMRDKTERQEAVESGMVTLVGYDTRAIKETVEHLMKKPCTLGSNELTPNPYGDGNAAQRILDILWNESQRREVTSA